jgi:hypothetical protein
MVCKDKHQNDNIHQKKKNERNQRRFAKTSIKTTISIKKRKMKEAKTK